MKFFRYRRPSWKTLLGVTKAKKRLKKDLGITAALKPLRWWTNQKRRFKRRIGYESEPGRLIRHGLPRPGGCLVMLLGGALLIGSGMLGIDCLAAAFHSEGSSRLNIQHPSQATVGEATAGEVTVGERDAVREEAHALSTVNPS